MSQAAGCCTRLRRQGSREYCARLVQQLSRELGMRLSPMPQVRSVTDVSGLDKKARGGDGVLF